VLNVWKVSFRTSYQRGSVVAKGRSVHDLKCAVSNAKETQAALRMRLNEVIAVET